MKVTILVALALAFTLFIGGAAPSPIQSTVVQRDLKTLATRGFNSRLLNDDAIELTNPLSGDKHIKGLREPNETQIRLWAAQRGIPVLEIDPNTIDTSIYSGWYNYWTTLPLGNDIGIPLVIGDLNHNGQADVYGAYLDTLATDYEARGYELDTSGHAFLRYQYVPRPGVSRQFADADRDSLKEVVWSIAGVVSGYEQPSRDSLPIYRTFAHDRLYHNSDPGYTGIYFGDLDGDSLTDFLYEGTGPDPSDTNIAIAETFVAEFDPTLQNFKRVWSTQFGPQGGATGFSVADFDSDGSLDFVATRGSQGKVFVAENAGDNQYAVTWADSTPFVNLYYHGSGDVDNDGKVEFLTGATMSDGNWALMFEADSNNAYSAKFLFHLLSGGVFAEPIYRTLDIDGDGRLELAMLVGADLYVFNSDVDNQYYLWYLKRENTADGVAFYDFNKDGRQDFVISKFDVNSQGRGWTHADAFRASDFVGVIEQSFPTTEFRLFPNYPNPFNPSTTIRYVTPQRSGVMLAIYNLLGQRVALLVDGDQEIGTHAVAWNAEGMPTGMYLCRLSVGGNTLVRKLLLVR